MSIKSSFFAVLVIMVFLISMPANANATLYDRGGGFIYDDTLNATWLQNAGNSFSSYGEAASWAGDLTFQVMYDNVYARDIAVPADNWRLPQWHGNDPYCPPDIDCFTYGQMNSLYFKTGITYDNPGPFINLGTGNYATNSPDFTVNETGPYYQAFNFARGETLLVHDSENFSALAIHDGDLTPVAVVPEPVSSALFIVGGATLGLLRSRQKK